MHICLFFFLFFFWRIYFGLILIYIFFNYLFYLIFKYILHCLRVYNCTIYAKIEIQTLNYPFILTTSLLNHFLPQKKPSFYYIKLIIIYILFLNFIILYIWSNECGAWKLNLHHRSRWDSNFNSNKKHMSSLKTIKTLVKQQNSFRPLLISRDGATPQLAWALAQAQFSLSL